MIMGKRADDIVLENYKTTKDTDDCILLTDGSDDVLEVHDQSYIYKDLMMYSDSPVVQGTRNYPQLLDDKDTTNSPIIQGIKNFCDLSDGNDGNEFHRVTDFNIVSQDQTIIETTEDDAISSIMMLANTCKPDFIKYKNNVDV